MNYIMEKEIYTCNLDPLTHQPSGVCDLEKIYNSKTVNVTITRDGKKERHTLQRIDIDDGKGGTLIYNPKCIKN